LIEELKSVLSLAGIGGGGHEEGGTGVVVEQRSVPMGRDH
jgi:hypothetical protein